MGLISDIGDSLKDAGDSISKGFKDRFKIQRQLMSPRFDALGIKDYGLDFGMGSFSLDNLKIAGIKFPDIPEPPPVAPTADLFREDAGQVLGNSQIREGQGRAARLGTGRLRIPFRSLNLPA